MARSLSVKIPTASLIADIEASLAQIEADIKNYPLHFEAYQEQKLAHREQIVQAVIKALGNPENIGTQHGSVVRVEHRYNNQVSVTVDSDVLGLPEAPKEPEKPNERQYYGRDYMTRKELLERNLKVLKMTSQEEVSASTYNTVIDLL
jgi:hypothetical protein